MAVMDTSAGVTSAIGNWVANGFNFRSDDVLLESKLNPSYSSLTLPDNIGGGDYVMLLEVYYNGFINATDRLSLRNNTTGLTSNLGPTFTSQPYYIDLTGLASNEFRLSHVGVGGGAPPNPNAVTIRVCFQNKTQCPVGDTYTALTFA